MPKADMAKERHWRSIIADAIASGMSDAAYCRQHNLIYSQLRNWVKRLKQRDAQAAKTKLRARTQQPVHSREGTVEFAEVQITERQERCATAPPKEDEHSMLEVIFPSGVKVRVASGCSLDLLSSVVSVLENR